MALGEKIIDSAANLLPGLIPPHLKKRAGAWLQDRNPFASIADNDDLRRVLRLAFIDATNEVLSAAEKAAENPEWAADANPARYISLARPLLRDLRAATFDRRPALAALAALDDLLPMALRGAVESELVPSATDAATQLTDCFATVMTGITAEAPPPLLIRLACDGVTTHAGPRRAFGPLLCAALAEILKKPQEYPEASAAFDMAMTAQTHDKLDEILATLRAGGVLQQAADKGIPEAAMRAIVERAGGQGVAGDDLVCWLEGWIDAAQRELSRQPDPDKAFAAAADEAARRFRTGSLAEASGAFMDAFDREEAQHRQRQTRLLQDAIRYDELALNPAAAVNKLCRLTTLAGVASLGLGKRLFDRVREYKQRWLAALDGVIGPDSLGHWLFNEAGEYYRRGEKKGDNAALLMAIEAYQAVLQEWPRERVPLQWAGTQNNLGNTLARLGERESGTARLEQAVTAYQLALLESPRDRVPLGWAGTQNNLGNALQTLGGRENDARRLEAAVAAYELALQEWTRERVPLDWAATQNNLGNALRALGERESGTARLEAAVTAYQSALLERTRYRVPLDWAGTQNNLGAALWMLGTRESGTARLEAAVTAYQSALLESPRERVPLDWATTQNNLGAVLRALGEREGDAARLEQGIQHITDALALYREANHVPYATMAEQNLSLAQTALENLRRKKQ